MAEKSAATLASGSHDTPAVSVRSVHRLATSSARRHYNGRESAPSGRDNASRHHTNASRHHATPSTTHAHQSSSTSVVKCNCCGAVGHFSKQCKYYGCVCHKCGKTNHLKKVCRSQARGKSGNNYSHYSNKGNFNKGKHHFVESVLDNNDDETDVVECIGNLFELAKVSSRVDPLKTKVTVENKVVSFEIDTGASVSVISESFYHENLKFLNLLPTDVKLSSYTNVPILPIGRLEVNVKYEKYPEVFSKELGQCNRDPIRLVLKENNKPKYTSPRPLPFTLKAKVEQELERLVNADVLMPRHVDQLIAVDTAPVTDQTAEVITAESEQTARSDCADDNPVGSNRTADAPRHSISVRPSTAMSPNASHTHTTYTSPITQRSPLARSTPVRRYPQRERKPITRLDL
ncbi:uncharacterized protein LOC124371535 [Homalodisca vitripennis]|uniref:uncharacterized protein LOC124371535 n=1 Tax=Homalodisca vitripennis TaxID=197043 RepID=UPI001EEA2D99|nr:uncharacterized protein LOC124371535 [Homalodisca vitripennis]